MKILHLSSTRAWRGGEQQIAYLLTGLRSFQAENVVFCVSGSPLQAWCHNANVPYKAYRKANLSPVTVVHLIRTVRQFQPDVIHVHDSHSHLYAILASTIMRWHYPVVLHRRVDFPMKQNVFSRWKYNHPAIRAILCVSQCIRQLMLQGIRRKEIVHTVYSGIDPGRFGVTYPGESGLRHLFEIPADHAIVANIASIAPHKDYTTFVNTVQLLKSRGLRATYVAIGGDGGELEYIRQYARQSNVDQDILFTGFREDVPALAQDIDVLLVTSKEEGLCTTILDAFAGQIPVVATMAGGIPELVRHEYTGLLAPVGNAELLAASVKRMLTDAACRKQCIENAHLFVQDFTFHKMAAQVWQHYSSITNTPPGAEQPAS